MSSLLADIALQVDLVDIALMTLLVIVAIAIIRLRNLFEVVVLSGIFSLLSACIFTTLDAVDVAFTEAAVGAGISTVLFLATMAYLPGREKVLPPSGRIGNAMAAGIICVFAGALLVAAAVELPAVGDPNAPAHIHVAPRYLAESDSFLHIPNVVTTVLASYRGFDTLGETVVVFTAGLGVLVLLSGFTRTRRAAQDRAGVKEDSDA